MPLHASRVVRQGTDVTLVGHGAMVATLLQAADIAAGEGTSLEVVDLRSLSPSTTGRCSTRCSAPAGSSWRRRPTASSSIGSEIAATVAERAFYSLEAPVLRVSGFDTPFPPAALETEYLPSPDRVLEAVDRALAY